ncbi:BREX-1 system adenine-specific DNA-methyltransferase PglX [Ancylothrix sp. C2]|uniref:BREX-1 system adenine-specific DNA-methyltransferase PglX n=1 Tax=Ancylothrix sp. D3o TaxID=2953691 RepID=UPI0021BA3D69|nr:BREX-1 system adenine-specific DNA-methyltransferase PglX [Ancylothrix sp. D3o]MCT7951724.1 BREX-1 system adenine-specific DNA-methyltransferase PglX [Ancylothrix sp. D3o]
MPHRLLQLDDVRNINNPDKIASLFQKLGYNAAAQSLNVEDLQLPVRCADAIKDVYLIADEGNAGLQVLLFQLHAEEWVSPSVASGRMKAIANSMGRRSTHFLLLATRDFNQLMLVNPRKSFDAEMNLKTSIYNLLIDRKNPTNYDRDRLEAIAAFNLSPDEIYAVQCDAFDVEKLTKSFYRGYKDLFDRVEKTIKEYNDCSYFKDAGRLHQFSQRFLGRIMFLYFLQKKEFLAGDRNFLSNQFRKHLSYTNNPPVETGVYTNKVPGGDYTNQLRGGVWDDAEISYYSQVLEPLFFETLNQQRPNLESRWGKIPYLNGGLFERDYGEGIRDAAGRETPAQILLPNSIFDPGSSNSILGFFNGYNFTIAENVLGNEDVAIDPEMLGKVFENMLAAEERGQSGTFYTPRGIVQFMCAEVLGRYLVDATGMELEAVNGLINYEDDFSTELLITPQEIKKLKKALSGFKVLDPAVGSGAFPLGMMQVILNVKQAIAKREGMTIQRGSLRISEWKREIIANNLYGVDIKPEAIEISKLRMWLSLVVDIPKIEDVEPLPNLDYKLMCGDSLISTINGEVLIPDPTKDVQQLSLLVTPVQQAIQPLLELQRQYFEADSSLRNEIRGQILTAEKEVFKTAIADRMKYWVEEKRQIEENIKRLKKSSKIQEKRVGEIAGKIAELESFALAVEGGERAVNFFQYYLHFRDVFEEKGGFDVVIGNPPYVRQEAIKDLKPALQLEYDCYTGVADLYVYFYERGFNLLRNGGYLSYISSNKYFRAGYGEKLRKLLAEKAKIEYLIDFGDAAVFEAIAYPSIILVRNDSPENHRVKVLNWQEDKSIADFNKVFLQDCFEMEQSQLTADGWRLESSAVLNLLDKLRKNGTPLGEYVNGRFYRGILTGFNEAFVVDRETRDGLIAEDSSSADVLKPFLRGRDVKRWCVDYKDLWLLFIPWHFPLHNDSSIQGASLAAETAFKKQYPAIYKHLLKFKDQLSSRNQAETGVRYEWYALQRCAASYWQEFEEQKIFIPAITQNVEYAADYIGYFGNDKTSICVTDNVKFLLGLLNSKILGWFIRQIAPTKQGGFYEFKPTYVTQIPIPTASESEKQKIESLVQKCLDAKGQGVVEWEAEIDEIVAGLYGLTEEEMRIIWEINK